MNLFVKGVDSINEWVGKAVSWLFLALIASVVIDLSMRYITGRTTVWAFDINYMIYGTNFMLAGAYTLKYNAHVRVDVLYNLFSPRGRAILEVIFYVLIMFPALSFLFITTLNDFIYAWQTKEASIVSSWHPPVYHFKGVMPATFALLILQSLAQFVRAIITIKKGE